MGYEPGDCFTAEKYYITDVGRGVCLHALTSTLTLLTPLLKGVPARVLGIPPANQYVRVNGDVLYRPPKLIKRSHP